MALGIAVVVVLGIANTFSALALCGILRFSCGRHHRLSSRLFRDYLTQPYGFFVECNSAGFSKTILTEVMQVVTFVDPRADQTVSPTWPGQAVQGL